MLTARLHVRSEGQVRTEFWLRSEYVTTRLCLRPGDWVKTRFESKIPSFAETQCCLQQYMPGISLARLFISHPVAYWRLNLYAGAPGECNPAWVDTKMEVRPPGISKYTSSVGDLLPGTRIEFLPMGEVRGTLVTREFLAAGKKVQIYDEDDVVLFSGKVIQAAHDATNDTWALTATDDVSEAGLDNEIPMMRYPDIVDALPYDIEDLSEKTLFSTIPVSGITVRYWLGILESLRNARLFFDPGLERHVLSDRPRMWAIKDVLSFTQRVDASQYFNVIIAEQNDSWEEEAERKTTVSEYGDYKLTVDRAGEKIFKATLKSATETLAQDEFGYNELDQVIKTVSRKGISTTTTTYAIQQGKNPYIRSEVSTTVVVGSETPFSERRQKKASLLANPDGTLLVLLNEKREWFEKKQEVTYE